MEGKKIIFFDIDGTLVNPRERGMSLTGGVPESTKKAIQKLKDKGYLVAIATGRFRLAMEPMAEYLGIDTFIASNGQEIVYKNEVIHQQFIEDNYVEILATIFRENEIPAFYDTQKGLVKYKNVELETHPLMVFNEIKAEDFPKNVFQILAHAENQEKIKAVVPTLKVVKTSPQSIDIFPHEVSKASGIERLLVHLNLTAKDMVAFGDEENDIEMIQLAEIGVAMGNGAETVKNNADFVTKDVWDDGIHHACLELGLID